jgi:hypothetical protein
VSSGPFPSRDRGRPSPASRQASACRLKRLRTMWRARGPGAPQAPPAGRAALGVLGMSTEQRGETCKPVKSSWGPDGGNPPSTRQGRQVSAAREGASGRSLMMQCRTERKRSAAEASDPAGELANGSEAHIRRAGGRIGDGVGTKFCVLTRGDLSASAQAVAIVERKTRGR